MTDEPSSMPSCRRGGKPADDLDLLCTRCRAIGACDHLVDDLTNALENSLDARCSPHEIDDAMIPFGAGANQEAQ